MMHKKLIPEGLYYFTALAGKIVFHPSLKLNHEDLLIIVNQETNKIIYNFACEEFGGILSNNILTLVYDTTLMNDSDKLSIFAVAPNETDVYLSKILDQLKELTEILINEKS